MLDLNRPRDTGVQRCHPAIVAREVSRLALVGAGRDALQIVVSGDDGLEAAMGPDALKQVLLNLVQNGREAYVGWANKPAGPARVVIDVAASDGEIRIEVSDNGPGIPPEILSRIFDPFFTTKEAVHGVGLGLFVAEGLVRTAGGKITAGNAPASAERRGGAWFRIELPIATQTADISRGDTSHSVQRT
jgi:signal transduction histidine kinase